VQQAQRPTSTRAPTHRVWNDDVGLAREGAGRGPVLSRGLSLKLRGIQLMAMGMQGSAAQASAARCCLGGLYIQKKIF